MKRIWTFVTLLLLLLVAACSPAAEPTPTPLPTFPPPAETDTPESGYPAPAQATMPPEAYPAEAPTPLPEPTGYPDDARVWLVKPAGAQCQEYTVDLRDAVAALRDAGVEVINSQVVNLLVCEACDVCPSSEHYRVLVDAGQRAAAEALGWVQE
jgi:hypothetical protein